MSRLLMTDSEYLESAPRFLGLILGTGLVYAFLEQPVWLYVTLGLMVLLMLRLYVAHVIAAFLQQILEFLGRNLVWVVLGVLYLVLITPYAVLVRTLDGTTSRTFFKAKHTNSSWREVNTTYDKSFFEKTW